MDILTLTMSLVLVAAALGLILYPLWQQSRPQALFQPDSSGQTLEEYQARYQAALAAIKDLMFDYEMGKVSLEDHERLLAKAKLEAAEIRRQIDRFSHSTSAHIEASLDVEIEKLIAQLRFNKFSGNETLLPEVDAEIELLKMIRLDPAGVDDCVCPRCGKVCLPGDAFCAACGQSLAELMPSSPTEVDMAICPACGFAYQPGDAFCAKCGFALSDQKYGEVVTE
jgi:hypothetical protein